MRKLTPAQELRDSYARFVDRISGIQKSEAWTIRLSNFEHQASRFNEKPDFDYNLTGFEWLCGNVAWAIERSQMAAAGHKRIGNYMNCVKRGVKLWGAEVRRWYDENLPLIAEVRLEYDRKLKTPLGMMTQVFKQAAVETLDRSQL